jgi:hypothetical protein
MSASFREVLRPNEAAPPADTCRRWLASWDDVSCGWHRRRPPELGRTSGLRHTANPEIPSPLAPDPPGLLRRCRWWCLAGDGEGSHQLLLVLPPGDPGSSSIGRGSDEDDAASSGRRLRRTMAESHEVERRGGSSSFLLLPSPSASC